MDEPNQAELMDRLALIERMVAEGRRSTERWGWVFLLWGAGPAIAILWAARWPHGVWAWPVTTIACIAINGLGIRGARKWKPRSGTAPMRSIGAIWQCAAISLAVLTAGALYSGVAGHPMFFAALFALPAIAHGASSAILRWPPQFIAAIVWWLASLAAFAVPAGDLQELATVALVFGNVVFGAYLTYRERSRANV